MKEAVPWISIGLASSLEASAERRPILAMKVIRVWKWFPFS